MVHMKKELELFYVDGQVGWNQDRFKDWWMNKGGCGAVTACDCCIYLARRFKLAHLYPFDASYISSSDYVDFAMKMKPFLSPRFSGIDTIEAFNEGFNDYLKSVNDKNVSLGMLYSSCEYPIYAAAVKKQLNADLPVPMLVLKHKSPAVRDFVWHWFWLGGYEEFGSELMVKVITYGTYFRLPLRELWDSGYSKKGGIVTMDIKK